MASKGQQGMGILEGKNILVAGVTMESSIGFATA
jgi:enoyl-[acyl-carrier-protein] reductase (NADH)